MKGFISSFFRQGRKEAIIYLVLWIVLYMAPAISLYVRMTNCQDVIFDLEEIIRVWQFITIFLIAFLIHNFLLVPILVYRHQVWPYLLSTLCLLTVFGLVQCFYNDNYKYPSPQTHLCRRTEHQEAVHHKRPGCTQGFGFEDVANTFGIFLMLGMNLGVKSYFKSRDEIEQLQQAERHNLQQQLQYLKYQVPPHFFMNTLNNIHALVDIDPPKAKVMIVELSKMMRYILYEGSKDLIPLKLEVEFLSNYMTLMKLRFADIVKINFDVPDNIPNKFIPPLLFIIFVENAFKHGVSYQTESFITISLSFDNDYICFRCLNSKNNHVCETKGGFGLANVKKRLELLYGDDYQFDITDRENTFGVKLCFPCSEKKAIT